MNVVKLVQGSPEWHEHRKSHRNASETAAVLGLSPWLTPYQLWEIKTGRRPQPEVTAAMAHGTKLEPLAREAYEQLTGHVMEPVVLVKGEYSASLDGITLDGQLVLEVKCPKSKDSRLLAEAKAAHVPVDVYWQIQTQLLVSGARLAHLYVFEGTTGILLEQKPEPEAWATLRREWDRFMELVRLDQPPPLTEGDTLIRTDAEWLAAAEAYLETKLFADQSRKALEEAKERLVALTTHSNETGGGVTVTRYWRKGSIDYSRVIELASIDLERYRGAPKEEVRVCTVNK
jgi:putative phage-type endonuclease